MRLALLWVLVPSLVMAQMAASPGRMANLRLSGTLTTNAITGSSTTTTTITSSTAATGSTDTAFALNASTELSRVAATDVLVDFNNGGTNIWRFWSSGFMTVTSQESNRAPGFEIKAGTGGRLMWRLTGGSGEIAEMVSNDTDITTWRLGDCPATNCVVNLGPSSGSTPELVLTKGTGVSGKFNVRLDFDSTDNSASPGATTISKPAGKAAIAAGAASVVVTNTLVTTASIVIPVVQTADATCTFIKSVVPASGSFTVTANANCTAATKVGFVVHN